MSILNALYHLALGGAIALCLLLAWVIWRKARDVAGAAHLARFLVGTSVGIGGFWLLSLPGEGALRWGERLVGISPLVGGLFTHFAYRFSAAFLPAQSSLAEENAPERPSGRGDPAWRIPGDGVVGAGYLAGAAGTLLAWFLGLGTPLLGESPPATLTLSPSGWVMVAITVTVTLLGHIRLLGALRAAASGQRRRILAVMGAALWGLIAIAGFFLPALGVGAFPWPVLLLPGYPLLLVYALLRYRLMDVNVWAQRTTAWLLLTLPLTGLSVGLLALASSPEGGPAPPSVWAMQFLTLSAAFLLVNMIRRWADRLVYPGGRLERWAPARWERELAEADDPPALADLARRLIGDHLNMPVAVHLPPLGASAGETPALEPERPAILCHDREGRWTHALAGWDHAPPGPRLAAELFGRLVAAAAQRLERTRRAAEQARQKEREAHLAELGLLAATVAHELRNPLNVIGMATTRAPAETQVEIKRQLARMDRLIGDLLDYAKAWRISPRPTPLAPAIDNALSAFPCLVVERAIPEGLRLLVDPARFQQVLANLLANAQAAVKGEQGAFSGAGLAINAESGSGEIRLILCNQGAPIPENLRARIFAPFVSRSVGGTGLGLAIVARIMAAHGGAIRLLERPGWPTCFELTFPNSAAEHEPGETPR